MSHNALDDDLILQTSDPKAVFLPRNKAENPFSADCKPAFRRICGTCKHFPDGAAFYAEDQPCAHFGFLVDGDRRAGSCRRWERR